MNAHPPHKGLSDSAALLELSQVINGSQDLEFILGNVLLSSMGKLMIARGCVLLRSAGGTFTSHTCKGMRTAVPPADFTIDLINQEFIDLGVDGVDHEELGRLFVEFCDQNGLQYIAPMILKDEVVGLLALGPKFNHTPVSSDEIVLLESIASVAATAVGNAMWIEELRLANRRLDAKIQEQQTLYEVSREMTSTFEEEAIYRLLGYALMGQLRILRYALLMETPNGYQPVMMKLQHFKENNEACHALMQSDVPRRLSDGITLSVAEQWMKDAGVEVLIPMVSQNQVLGMLCLGQRMGTTGYSDSDIEYLQALANRTIVAMENARMVREILDKQRLEEQIQVARNIQRELLPRTIPDIPEYDICADNMSSQSVGGDYYDIVPLEGERTLIAIADVSGKGIPASLLMSNIQAGLRTIAPVDITLEEATARLNKLIYDNTSADKFITFFWGILDWRKHTLTYVNAGHNPPVVIHENGSYKELNIGGVLLGALEVTPPYERGVTAILPGDMLVLYTDGFNEAMSQHDEEFGEERMYALLTKKPFGSAIACMDEIKNELLAFTDGAEQSDDITLITLYRTK